MNAEELYTISLDAHKSHNSKFTNRLSKILGSAGYFDENKAEFDGLRLRADVMDGSIWDLKGIGVTSVQQICEWLEHKGYLKQ